MWEYMCELHAAAQARDAEQKSHSAQEDVRGGLAGMSTDGLYTHCHHGLHTGKTLPWLS